MPILKNLILSPYSRELRNGKVNPKNYPFWGEVIRNLKETGRWRVLQVGIGNEQPIDGVSDMSINCPFYKLVGLLEDCTTWASIDNFFPHFAHVYKPGVVVWGKSNPLLFGYTNCINLVKDSKYFRSNQFGIWEEEEFDANCFSAPEDVAGAINEITCYNGTR